VVPPRCGRAAHPRVGRRDPRPHGGRTVSNVFRALRARNYRLYFSGQLVSLIGTWMQIIGQSWLVFKMTGKGLDVGILSAMQFTPMLLGGAWGGLLADRFPKRRTLMVTQAAFAVCASVLAVLVTG